MSTRSSGSAPAANQPGADGLEALAQVVPQVHELADHLRVDEGHMGTRGLLDLVLAVGHHELACARAVELGRVGVERPVEADDGGNDSSGAHKGLPLDPYRTSTPKPI